MSTKLHETSDLATTARTLCGWYVDRVRMVERLVFVLRGVEWWAEPHKPHHKICPWCNQLEGEGHAPDCQLDMVLRANQ